MDNLSISLTERRARQTEWRVFAISLASGVLFAVFLFVFFALTQSLRTISSVADEQVETIAFKNTRSAKALAYTLTLPIDKTPFSLNELVDTRAKSIAFHYKEGAFVGFSLDHAPESILSKAVTAGLVAQTNDGITTITVVPISLSNNPKSPFVFRTLFSQGLHKNELGQSRVTLKRGSLTLSTGSTPFTTNSAHLPSGSVVTAVSNTSGSELIYGMGPYRLITGSIGESPFFHLTTSSILQTDSLIEIGAELSARTVLSTQALTTEDGFFREHVNGKRTEPVITSDGDITTITFSARSTAIYIVKTQEITTITNIPPSPELVSYDVKSACLKRAHSFALNSESFTSPIVKELAESRKRLRICF